MLIAVRRCTSSLSQSRHPFLVILPLLLLLPRINKHVSHSKHPRRHTHGRPLLHPLPLPLLLPSLLPPTFLLLASSGTGGVILLPHPGVPTLQTRVDLGIFHLKFLLQRLLLLLQHGIARRRHEGHPARDHPQAIMQDVALLDLDFPRHVRGLVQVREAGEEALVGLGGGVHLAGLRQAAGLVGAQDTAEHHALCVCVK